LVDQLRQNEGLLKGMFLYEAQLVCEQLALFQLVKKLIFRIVE
jgi:hypothetical protein